MSPAEIRELIWKVDNEPGIPDYSLSNGLSIWLIFRHDFYYFLLAKAVPEPAPAGNAEKGLLQKIQGRISFARYVWNAYRKSPLKVKQRFDVLNICTTAGSYLSGSCYRSRMSGFLDDIPEIHTLHVFYSHNKAFHKKYCGNHCFADFLSLKELIRQKVSVRKRGPAHLPELDSFLNHLRTITGNILSDKDILGFKDAILLCNSYIKGYEENVRRFVQRVRPGLMIIEDGNYGNWLTAVIIKVAKEMQLVTAEIQHGVFDVAFQYGDRLISHKDFSKYKTDYVLTFGPYFTRYIRSTSRNISIGNHYLELKKLQSGAFNSKSNSTRLLFISQRHLTNPIIPILYKALKMMDKPVELTIRLHPSESVNTGRYEMFKEFKNVSFSHAGDIYDLVAGTDYVIGLYSTVLFEAVYFDKMPVVYRNDFSDEFLPAELGLRFGNAEELVNLIRKEGNETRSAVSRDFFWSAGSIENFRAFLSNSLSRKS